MEAKKLFAERFKSARLINGFSLQDLADAVGGGLSRQALHRYEKGDIIPDSEKINRLSKALNVSPDYFFRDTKIELGPIEYRKLSKMPQKEVSIINETTKEYLSRYLELEEIIGLNNHFEHPLNNFGKVSNYNQINEAAKKLREAWSLGTGPIFNIVELLEDKNIKVVKLNVDEDFDGLQTFVNKTIPVVAYNERKANKPDRIRFTLLHELAHLLLSFDDITERQKETLCHQFAGAMLLPEKTIKEELGEHRNRLSTLELGNIKKQYGISMQAIVMRAKDCHIINEHYTKQFFFLIRQQNWKIDEPYDYEGIEKSNRFEQLLFRALIEDQISMSKAASLSNMSLAEFRKIHQPMF
ncbi:helix-turn-helix domain-containing protein [Riemerella anatipestifer]|uniref:helix-turn-helix domain-containing protein n=1 Tax=Riemerella anatipestifer TaxID=34085 RepID=UPI001372CE9D|nr:XRE family transcriptional regulator [Riemerella anatipestifer]MBT0549870.1 ImmA/IrrE family metallo-endopeptidase [Riemerella anatipestifer]MBT0556541.1 ImmA/IrrE family metallo-endopeptidase [Riemerella anatipestifer]MBT0560592.1 ImmA/IrrE family metallo-endopeptidase [Riemerella anatipestifer]NAV16987.1 helix-turn-helix domain-containing protein [Riemerella anatipestifer]UZX27783.1 XRE family transcriptional regulator [Riemerella anatipestifer]